jgi:hypothetical protein
MLDVQGLSKIKELIVWSWTYLWALWFLLVMKKKTVRELFSPYYTTNFIF